MIRKFALRSKIFALIRFRRWTNLIEYFEVTPSYVQILSDGAVITHSFNPIGTQALSHSMGVAMISIIDNTGTNVYGSTTFANTGSANCPLPGVPIELIRDNGQIMKATSAADGTFSFSVALGEPVQVRIPPYHGFAWSTSYFPITPLRRKLASSSKGSSQQPSMSPSLEHFPLAKMIHRFTFDHTAATSLDQIPDVLSDNDFAAIHNGVTLSDSRAVFSQTVSPTAQPYLSLSPGWFGIADAISIEMWVTVDFATQDSAVLFSFGDPTTSEANIVLNAKGFQGFSNTYVAVVINPPAGSLSVYVNGTLNSTMSIPTTPLFGGDGTTEHFNCIGWNLMKTTPGFIGAIDEVRFWDGALAAKDISETFVLGVNPTLVVLSSNDTIYNIQIDYLVISEVVVHVGFYGGLSQNKMFGSESVFLVEALDPQCTFNTTVSLDPFYSETNILLPAMNYSVTLQPYASPLPAPKFTYSMCSPSLDPYTYLATADELSMQVYTDLLVTFNLYATFIYHTGLCMSIKGAENFATSEPTPDQEGRACYNKTVTMLQRGQVWPLNITLFELYPSFTGKDPAWASSKTSLDVSSGAAVLDRVVLDSTVEITDVVSGFSSPLNFVYSESRYTNVSPQAPAAPPDLNYSITAATPLPSPPYALPITVLATRNSPEGAAQVSFKAFIPILGTIPSEVPNLFPVTTDPTLIFLILRDPPGGTSQTKIEAGSTFTTSIAIEGLRTFVKDVHYDVELSGKGDPEDQFLEAPLGFGVGQTANKEESKIGAKGSVVAPEVTVSRTSETHYSYAFKFSYDFSTSDDAFTAGHPSDVIVGGGIDIILSEAIEGRLND